jgi:hypothetical protein
LFHPTDCRRVHPTIRDGQKKRKIVDFISTTQINRFLKDAKLQPHRSRYWLTTTEEEPALSNTQLDSGCLESLSIAESAGLGQKNGAES